MFRPASRSRSFLAVAAFVLCVAAPARAEDAPSSGTYKLDPAHTSVTFKISHLGFSHFTGRFDHAEGTLVYNAAAPEQSTLDVTVPPTGIDTNVPELDETLRSENWFNVLKYPRATFHVKQIERTGAASAKISGDFTLLDTTHTLVLDATLIGNGKDSITGDEVMGFSASGSFKRSSFGMSNLSSFVGDDVALQIEAEFDLTKSDPAKSDKDD